MAKYSTCVTYTPGSKIFKQPLPFTPILCIDIQCIPYYILFLHSFIHSLIHSWANDPPLLLFHFSTCGFYLFPSDLSPTPFSLLLSVATLPPLFFFYISIDVEVLVGDANQQTHGWSVKQEKTFTVNTTSSLGCDTSHSHNKMCGKCVRIMCICFSFPSQNIRLHGCTSYSAKPSLHTHTAVPIMSI